MAPKKKAALVLLVVLMSGCESKEENVAALAYRRIATCERLEGLARTASDTVFIKGLTPSFDSWNDCGYWLSLRSAP